MTQFIDKKENGDIARWSFNEGEGGRTRDSVTGIWDPIEFALAQGRYQPPQTPRWAEGIGGQALLFDGYSTYIRRSASDIASPKDGLTISVWIAPGTYDLCADNRPSTIVNQHDREGAEGFLLGIGRHGAWTFQLGIDGIWTELWTDAADATAVVPLQTWSHLAAAYDGQAGKMKLFLNGEIVAARDVPKDSVLTPSQTDLLIGRNNQGALLAEAFIMNHFDGRMDELFISARAMSDAEIKGLYLEGVALCGGTVPELAPQDFILPREMFIRDRHRPQYHVTTPGHWMNEPHAPFYYEGRYHLFYQFNPKGPFFHYLHWGHSVSEDLVHWRDLPPALRPEPGIDPDGVWSGSATYDEEGQPALFYTTGNHSLKPNQQIGLARPRDGGKSDPDLIAWTKRSKPVLMLDQDEELLDEFRDPFVWRDQDRWVMLVGAGLKNRGGTALAYVSDDLENWTPCGPFYESDPSKYPFLGTAWELPVLLPLRDQGGNRTDKHVFVVSPWGPGAVADIRYWIGRYDSAHIRFVPDHEEPRLIDYGDFHFTGPSGMVDPKTGRSILFTIAQGERSPEIDYDSGWSHGAGMPVTLTLLDDSTLGVSPIEEIALLREETLLDVRNVTLEAANLLLDGIHGSMLEIELELQAAGRTAIALRRSPGGEEETVLYCDRDRSEIGVDRTRSTLDPKERTRGIQSGPLALGEQSLRLHVLLDRSLIEAYFNGRKCMTTRTYPSRLDADGLRLDASPGAVVERLTVRRMGGAYSYTEI
ncbi:GH32 C-terminal domain-containing protein [Cohnella hashimotonis]|uniref:beta-fructofuranosidase n=1 Tax=Cohnella hashimotonis TaxID=2826895 RepID=A0ABT6T9L9_9BACL|nr:GH32 C-terminal domain-containing protein [Cohnella hashimotonis]MDI4643519.1 GH32 C-terminal domain-containing protein [Cohnella hashimotonis]